MHQTLKFRSKRSNAMLIYMADDSQVNHLFFLVHFIGLGSYSHASRKTSAFQTSVWSIEIFTIRSCFSFCFRYIFFYFVLERFEVNDISENVQNISTEFYSIIRLGFLFYIFQSNAFGAALFNGNLVVSITSDEKVSNIDSAEKYDDDKWHYLTVTKVDKQ